MKEHIFQLLKAVYRGLAIALMEMGDRREHDRRGAMRNNLDNVPSRLAIRL